MNIFSSRLKYYRKDNKKTQEDMAKFLGIQRSTYGEYERGKIMPPMDKIQKLADYFNVSVDYLLGNTNFETHDERKEAATDVDDISKNLKTMIEKLQKEQHALTFDGELLDEDSRELLISSLKNSLKMAQMINKRKDK